MGSNRLLEVIRGYWLGDRWLRYGKIGLRAGMGCKCRCGGDWRNEKVPLLGPGVTWTPLNYFVILCKLLALLALCALTEEREITEANGCLCGFLLLVMLGVKGIVNGWGGGCRERNGREEDLVNCESLLMFVLLVRLRRHSRAKSLGIIHNPI